MSPRTQEAAAPLFPWRHAALVIAAAVALRVVYWVLASRSAFFHAPVVDASFFDIWARTLADGGVFQDQAFFKPPLYPYLLAGLYRIGLSLAAVQALQMAVGTLTAVLVLGLARLIFTPRVALGAALATALLPILPFFEGQLLAETWTTALTVGGLLVVQMVLSERVRKPGRWLLGAGVLLGLAALGRPNLLLVVLVLAGWLWRSESRVRHAGLGAAVAVLAGVLIAVAPVTLRNVGQGEFVLISANAGVNLAAGNSDAADGVSAVPVGVRWDDLQLRTQQARAGSPGASSAYLSREAGGWIVENPGRFLQLLGKKIVLLVNAGEGRNNINPRWLAEKTGVFVLHRWWPGTWLLMPLALVGLTVAARRVAGADLLRWLLAAQAVAVLPFFVNARFRAPLLPLLALFAAAAVAELWRRRAGDRRSLALALAGLALAFVAVNVDWFGLGGPRWLARDHYNRAMLGMNHPAAALPPEQVEGEFLTAIRLDPEDPDFPESYGTFLLQIIEPVMQQAEGMAATDPAGALAVRAEAREMIGEAAGRHRRAAQLFPRSYRSLANLGLCRIWQGDGAALGAAQALQQGETESARAQALDALNSYQQAVDAFQEALAVNPALGGARAALDRIWPAVLDLPPVDPRITAVQQELERRGQGR